jgi:hypothetical protein
MQRDRFENYHRAALRFPSRSFHYIGIDPPLDSKFDLDRAKAGVR